MWGIGLVGIVDIQTAYYMVAATGVLIAAIYYIVNIRATLQTRQAQLFMQLYDRWTFDIADKFWDFLDDDMGTAEELIQRERADKEIRGRNAILSRYHEGVGVLVRFGLLDIRYIAYLASWPTRMYWEKYKPIIEDVRRLQNAPRADSESEYLLLRVDEVPEGAPRAKGIDPHDHPLPSVCPREMFPFFRTTQMLISSLPSKS